MRNKRTSGKNPSLRPTTGRVREALFDILRGHIEEAVFLDLYAGTGAVGLDALREGASKVFFVEESRSLSKKINAMVEKYGYSGKSTVTAKKALSFIEWSGQNMMSFDIIFLDPPYHTDEITLALSRIAASDILGRDGILVAEHFSKKQLPDNFGALRKVRDYYYGDSVLSIYKKSV